MKWSLIPTFLFLISDTYSLEAVVSSYPDRSEIIKREYKLVDNYVVSRFGVFDLRTKKLKRRGFGITKKFQEQQLNCLQGIVNSQVMNNDQLNQFSKFIEFNDRFFKTKYGVLVERECLKDTTKEYVEKNILTSYKNAISCLQKLKGQGSKNLLTKINDLFKNESNPPKIFCSETDADVRAKGISWDGAKAYASASDKFSTEDMKHPFISLGQTWDWKRNPYSFQGTLFHELIHNTGCIHTETVEKAYTCQTCCFSEVDNPNAMMSPSFGAIEQKEVACKICQTEYQGISDKNYIRDFAKYSLLGGRANQLFPVLKTYMKESPGDNLAIEVLIESDSEGKIKTTLSNLINEKSNSDNTKYGNLGEILYHYSKADYVKAADSLRALKKQGAFFREGSYQSILDEVERDLTFMSFKDSRINVKGPTHFDGLFKKAKPFVTGEISL